MIPRVLAKTQARALQGIETPVEPAGAQVDPNVLQAAASGAGHAAGARTVVVVSADTALRQRLAERLAGLRWRVREASGGALAMMHLEAMPAEAMLVDSWLPDLEAGEFIRHVRLLYPGIELLTLDDGASVADERAATTPRSSRRNELLHAMRQARDAGLGLKAARAGDGPDELALGASARRADAYRVRVDGTVTDGTVDRRGRAAPSAAKPDAMPELVGASEAMQEVVRLIQMVAPRSTTVLIEGETGAGKELVARALHRLSPRAARPFAVINCAAIPELLLEAELFGHTRGAFTGATQARIGRVEAANGGTLLLDEIGEMPFAMQSKMLRFLESGELQRVGDNETTRVDVRLIAATHQPLEQRSLEGSFRMDLYHRLAVFPIELPPLRARMEDIPALAEHLLARLGTEGGRKRPTAAAMARLQEHTWPGNVRELMHVLERGAILAGVNPEIQAQDIRFRRAPRGPR
jgi:DNA-binding NtrC family response regulator